MATFRRAIVPGATYFFTINTNQRRKVLTNAPFSAALRTAFKQVNAEHPFTIDAFILLLDHSDWADSEKANDAAEDDYGEP